MKQKFISVCSLVIIVSTCAALFLGGNYVVYILAYIFSFVFLLCAAVLADTALLEKIVQTLLYALIMAAQIVFDILVLRPLLEGSTETCRLGRLVGTLLIFVPFSGKPFLCKSARNKRDTSKGEGAPSRIVKGR